MTSEKYAAQQPADLDAPGTFFEDAIEALENAEAAWRVREIEIKAHFMATLAKRLCDLALHAEAKKIACLAREKRALLPPGFKESNTALRTVDLLRTAADAHKRA